MQCTLERTTQQENFSLKFGEKIPIGVSTFWRDAKRKLNGVTSEAGSNREK